MVLSRNRSRRHAFRLRKSKRLRAQERPGGIRAYRRLPNSLTHPDPQQRKLEREAGAHDPRTRDSRYPDPYYRGGDESRGTEDLNYRAGSSADYAAASEPRYPKQDYASAWPGPPKDLPPGTPPAPERADWSRGGSNRLAPPSNNALAGNAPSLAAQLLALFAEPGVRWLSSRSIAQSLKRPIQDIRNLIASLEQAGYLESKVNASSPAINSDPFAAPLHDKLYRVHPHRKAELEHLYRQSAHALGETAALDTYPEAALDRYAEEDEPRLPITAGILSLFLPGTGQLLNGDIGRAVLVFAIWALAVIAPHPAIIIFVRLYAGAEAFFNAKLRRLAQQRAIEAAKERQQQKLQAAPPSLGPATPALPNPGGS